MRFLQNTYGVAKEVKSETKISRYVFLFDFFFVTIYLAVSFIVGNAVHEKLQTAFYVMSLVWAFFLTFKSRTNRGRRNIESIIIFLQRDKEIYHPEINISKRMSKEDL